MALIHNATFDSQTRVLSLLDKAGNVISSCEVPSKGDPLTLTATADNSSVKLTKNGTLSNTYEVNTGSGWQSYTFGHTISLNAGQSCKWRCSAHPTTQTSSNYVQFVMTGTIEASGNCNSMLSSDFENITSLTGYNYAFASLFQRCTSLTRAPELPATTLSESCYYKMFYECTFLVQAPELPALSIPDSFLAGRDGVEVFGCYVSMFEGCASLEQAPALPATTLGRGCYVRMFYGCRSLVQAPELPATTLPAVLNKEGRPLPAFGCYSDMFGVCTSLVQAPSLPATTLGGACYGWMFYECTSLVKAPELPATTLTFSCYAGMFQGCTSLNEIRVSATDISADRCTVGWVQNVSSAGDFYCNPDTAWTTDLNGIPSGWNRVNEGAPSVDDITKPLTFKATQDGSSVTLAMDGAPSGSFQTSRDGGSTWSDYTLNTAITLNTGDEVSFRAKADRTSAQDARNYFHFKMTGKIEAWHNVMSLYRTNDFATYNATVDFAFYAMFIRCTSLTKAPALPATTLADSCYKSMFYDCTSLVNAPALPATTLASVCYYSTFGGCTSLVNAPVLPATTLASGCYEYMFYACTSLVNAPALPATTLASECYSDMFSGCTSLAKSPELPATTLARYCYYRMFLNCGSLNEVRCQMPSTISASDISSSYADSWLSGVSSTGTFYTNADANWPSGANGIPTGWTRLPLSDYPQT